MLGTELSLLLEKSGYSFIGTDREVDITDYAALEAQAFCPVSGKASLALCYGSLGHRKNKRVVHAGNRKAYLAKEQEVSF